MCAARRGHDRVRNERRHVSVVIWHNPKCATSRKVLDMIRAQGISPRIVDYVKTPPSGSEIRAALKEMGIKPRALLRRAARRSISSALVIPRRPMPS
jgi:arsenate reductase (glutaredoxin)